MELVLFINRLMNHPKVSIIILNWNNYKNTKECLRSLFKIETYPNKEVIVIDNGSIDHSTERIEKEFHHVFISIIEKI